MLSNSKCELKQTPDKTARKADVSKRVYDISKKRVFLGRRFAVRVPGITKEEMQNANHNPRS